MVRQPPARRLFFRENFTALVLRQLALANLARVVELLCRGRLMTSILPLNPSLQRMASRPHTDDIERQLPGVESGKPKDRNRCETVIWLHNPNATSKSKSTFGLIQVAASLRPNAQHQPQGTRTACLQTFWARSGRIGQLPCAERIGSKNTINTQKQQITQTNCTQFVLKTIIIVHFGHWFASCV